MIENDKNVTTRRKPKVWPGMPTPMTESILTFYVFFPAIAGLAVLLFIVVRSCVALSYSPF